LNSNTSILDKSIIRHAVTKGPTTPINFMEAALTDELTYRISSHNACHIEEDEEGKTYIRLYHLYLEQAEVMLYRINVYDPLPEFVIYTDDIPRWLDDSLSGLDETSRKRIVTEAVRRIYESVDPEYFHTNGIYGKIR
jgi:hypothetical protein